MAKSKRAAGVVSAPSFRKKAEIIARDERAIQRRIDTKEKAAKSQKKKPEAMQAGARRYPVPRCQATPRETGPGSRPRPRADVRRAPLQGIGKAARTWSP